MCVTRASGAGCAVQGSCAVAVAVAADPLIPPDGPAPPPPGALSGCAALACHARPRVSVGAVLCRAGSSIQEEVSGLALGASFSFRRLVSRSGRRLCYGEDSRPDS